MEIEEANELSGRQGAKTFTIQDNIINSCSQILSFIRPRRQSIIIIQPLHHHLSSKLINRRF